MMTACDETSWIGEYDGIITKAIAYNAGSISTLIVHGGHDYAPGNNKIDGQTRTEDIICLCIEQNLSHN